MIVHNTSLYLIIVPPVRSGVIQSLNNGPMLFSMYVKPMSVSLDSHSIIHHSFVDDL